MYTIYCDGKVLHYPKLANEGYVVLVPKLTVELNKAGKLEYTLPVSNPMYDCIKKMKSIITVFQEDKEIFRGRCLDDKKDFYKRKKTTCEGEMAFLVDSVQRPYSFQGSIPEVFSRYVSIHNAQVDEEKQFEVGMVTDHGGKVTLSNSQYSDTLEEIRGKLLDVYGGYLRTRLENGVRYVDFVDSYHHVSGQTIEFGRNLLDLTEYINAKDVHTVLIPLGAQQKDAAGNTTGRLTIESVNDGKDYIEDATAVALFGRRWTFQKWDDITNPEELLEKGDEFLKSRIKTAASLEIQAVDLRHAGVDVELIMVGDYVRVISLPHGLDEYFLCVKIVYDLADPSKNKYIFGMTFKKLTEQQSSKVKGLQNSFVIVQETANLAQKTAQQASDTVMKMEPVVSEISADYVTSKMFEAYKEEMATKISAVYHYKGSVANYAALPTEKQVIGDVYNLLDTGANYAWTESGWDKLSETVDLSGYVTGEMFEAYKNDVAAQISTVYRFKGSIANYAALPTEKQVIGDVYNLLDTGENYAWTGKGWDMLSGVVNLSGYVTKEAYENLEERVKVLEGSSK